MMPSKSNSAIDALLAPMIRKSFFVAVSQAICPGDEMLPFVAEHLHYMNDLERSGLLFGSGPFVEPGVVVGDGLTILRAESFDEARTIMENEPLIRRGMRRYELRQWELREGFISVNLHCSQSRFRLS